MIDGLTQAERDNLSLTNARDYEYLKKGGCITCEGREDSVEYTFSL